MISSGTLTDQVRFKSKKWQQRERDADKDISAGRVKSLVNVDDLITDLRS